MTLDNCLFLPDTVAFHIQCADSIVTFHNAFIINSQFKMPLIVKNLGSQNYKRDSYDNGEPVNHFILNQTLVESVALDNVSNTIVIFQDLQVDSSISVTNSNIILELLTPFSTQQKLWVFSNHSTIYPYFRADRNFKNVIFLSNEDTITNFVLEDNFDKQSKRSFDAVFSHDIIKYFRAVGFPDTNYISTNMRYNVAFEYSKFDNQCNIQTSDIDSMEFHECEFLPGARLVPPIQNSPKTVFLNFINCDLTSLQMDYTSSMHLQFSELQSEDDIHRTYQTLIEKFKREGKLVSFENIDIEYQEYKLKRYGFAGRSWATIDKWWWKFGYDRSRILWHTLLIFSLFFSINVFLGNKILHVYPIVPVSEKKRWSLPFRYYVHRIIRIFILTIFVFFGLRIDFNKVDFQKTGILLYFFAQYFIGLLCLFFLFNAILKI